MKYLYLFSFLILLQGLTAQEIRHIEEDLLDGWVCEYDEEGLKKKSYYLHGVLEGRQIEYYAQDQDSLIRETIYRKGEIKSYREYLLPDRKLLRAAAYTFDYADSIRYSEEVIYNIDGTRKNFFTYRNGIYHGEQIEYELSRPRICSVYEKGVLLSDSYFSPGGKLSCKKLYKDNKLQIVEIYDLNGFLAERFIYIKNQEKKHYLYYPGTEIVRKDKHPDSYWGDQNFHLYGAKEHLFSFNPKEPIAKGEPLRRREKKKEGIVYNTVYRYSRKYAGESLSGDYFIYKEDGEGYISLSFVKGLIDGTSKEYDKNETLISEISYQKGMKEGQTCFYYPNGSLRKIEEYKCNELHGVVQEFNKEGCLIYLANYNNGNKVGYYYDTVGDRTVIRDFDTGAYSRYYKSGQLKVTGWYDKDGRKDGRWMFYTVEGVLYAEVNYVAGKEDGMCCFYYSDGSLMERAGYWMGEPDGIWQKWSCDGVLLYEVMMREGMREGVETFYYPDGEIKSISTYVNGIRKK